MRFERSPASSHLEFSKKPSGNVAEVIDTYLTANLQGMAKRDLLPTVYGCSREPD